jgi:hypothetical protein
VNSSKQAFPYESRIAGHTVLTNCPIAGAKRGRSRGAAIQFHFCSDAPGDDPDLVNGDNDADWYELPHFSAALAMIHRDGERVVIHETKQASVDRAALVRFFVPFAAALQGFVILHASAVGIDAHVVAFVGASGAGKSTIARSLAGQGLELIADDLLPIGLAKGRISVFGSASNVRLKGDLPLSAVYFIERDPQLYQPTFGQLTQQRSLLALLRHGFGEIGDTAVWRTQFSGYEQIALEVPTWSLQVPDSQPELPATMQRVFQEIRRHSNRVASLSMESSA